jgi:hypothetical protein
MGSRSNPASGGTSSPRARLGADGLIDVWCALVPTWARRSASPRLGASTAHCESSCEVGRMPHGNSVGHPAAASWGTLPKLRRGPPAPRRAHRPRPAPHGRAQPGAGRGAPLGGDAAHRAQNRERLPALRDRRRGGPARGGGEARGPGGTTRDDRAGRVVRARPTHTAPQVRRFAAPVGRSASFASGALRPRGGRVHPPHHAPEPPTRGAAGEAKQLDPAAHRPAHAPPA